MRTITQSDAKALAKRRKHTPAKDVTGLPRQQAASSFAITAASRAIVDKADTCWSAMSAFRSQMKRSSKFYKGEQWSDLVEVRDRWGNSKFFTEEEYIIKQGRTPLKQNLIRPQVRNVVGQSRLSERRSVVFSHNPDAQLAADMMTVALESVHTMNNRAERDARQMEAFLVSGAAIYITGYAYDNERQMPMPYYEAVDRYRFFQTVGVSDVCGRDVDFIGDFIDIPLLRLKAAYATTVAQAKALEEIYALGEDSTYTGSYETTPYTRTNATVASPSSMAVGDKCRVIRVCQQEGKWRLVVHDYNNADWQEMDYTKDNIAKVEKEIANRRAIAASLGVDYEDGANRLLIRYEKKFTLTWVYYHLTPYGHILMRRECPFEHKSHCYVAKFYPMFEGQAYGMVYDLIDMQKMINRMIILHDFSISASAKGLLMVPEESIPDNMSPEDFAEAWTRFGGILVYKAKDGIRPPEQVVSRQINVGQFEMVQLQMKMMSDVSGVHDALQGKTASANTPAALYRQEREAAQTNILDYLESFADMLEKRDFKMIQIIKQFYTEPRYIQVAGQRYAEAAKHYDPALVKRFDYYNEFEAPMSRSYLDGLLLQLLGQNLITLDMYLEETDAPFSKHLLEKVRAMQQQVSAGQMPSAEQMAALQQGVPQSGAADIEAMKDMLSN